MSESYDPDDPAALNEIENVIKGNINNIYFILSLRLAVALNSKGGGAIDSFVKYFGSVSAAQSAEWSEHVLGCCISLENSVWDGLFDSMLGLILNKSLDPKLRFELTWFLRNRADSPDDGLLGIASISQNVQFWRVLQFVRELARREYDGFEDYRITDIPSRLFGIDPAASHVWAYFLLSDAAISPNAKTRISELIEDNRKNYPAFADNPNEKVVRFWTEGNLTDKYDMYLTHGTNEGYKFIPD